MFSEDENDYLKRVCDAFVSPHRTEGFGINIAEAMALGKPVIATAYSGNTDFVTESTGFPVGYKLVEVSSAGGPYPRGWVWAEPDCDLLARRMEEVRQGGTRVSARAEAGRKFIADALSFEAVRSVIAARIAAISKPATRDGQHAAQERPSNFDRAWRNPLSLAHADLVPTLLSMRERPLISVIVPVYNIERRYLEACVKSVLEQSYPNWELCLCDDASTRTDTIETLNAFRGTDQRIKVMALPVNRGISGSSNAAAEIATGSYLAFLDNDDTLHRDALLRYAEAIVREGDADLLYCDEDKIDYQGNFVDHYFKPDWSPEHLESCMYVLHMMVVKKSTFLSLGGYREKYSSAQDYDLALRLSLGRSKVVHIPHVLYHWRMMPGSASAELDAKPVALQNARAALSEYAEAKFGPDAYVEDGQLFGLFRLRRGRYLAPPVTLVITTNNVTKAVDGRGMINLPGHFLNSIVERTDYPNYRVIIVSNGQLEAETRQLLTRIGGEEIVYEGAQSPFNFADKANFAIRSARTELVVLLNDDMEVRTPGWLRALVDIIQTNDVGAVGARLLYPSHQIQHVGMVLGVNGSAAHIYHGYPMDIVGYNGYPRVIRNYSAVTGACMATRRSLFEAVGGFDTRFAVDFNDTDYCLRLRERNYRVVYTPFCELFHFESQTSVRTSQNCEEVECFLSRWDSVIADDPYYNVNLDRASITFDPRPSVWPAP